MMLPLGIICAIIAMLCWGLGDFLIQRSTRKIGDWETIFFISLVGVVILAPFTLSKTISFIRDNSTLLLLLVSSVVLFVAALLEFEALRRGKLSIIEPIWSFEIVTSVLLASIFLGERLNGMQALTVILLIVGLILVSIRTLTWTKNAFLEKASLLALLSALVMGGANFMFGVVARETDPLVTNFFTSLVLAVFSFSYLLIKGKVRHFFTDLKKSPRQLLGMSILDNVAWVAFAFAMTLAPISIAVALSESYIIIAVLLGLVMNKERLHTHQKAGLVIAIVAAIILATTI
jgi:uncharacterized membrane protein